MRPPSSTCTSPSRSRRSTASIRARFACRSASCTAPVPAVRLTVADWAPILCEQLSYLQSWTSSELLLHHRGGDARIEDVDGEALEPFGATWVDFDADYYLRVDGDRPEMPFPSPCPT